MKKNKKHTILIEIFWFLFGGVSFIKYYLKGDYFISGIMFLATILFTYRLVKTLIKK